MVKRARICKSKKCTEPPIKTEPLTTPNKPPTTPNKLPGVELDSTRWNTPPEDLTTAVLIQEDGMSLNDIKSEIGQRKRGQGIKQKTGNNGVCDRNEMTARGPENRGKVTGHDSPSNRRCMTAGNQKILKVNGYEKELKYLQDETEMTGQGFIKRRRLVKQENENDDASDRNRSIVDKEVERKRVKVDVNRITSSDNEIRGMQEAHQNIRLQDSKQGNKHDKRGSQETNQHVKESKGIQEVKQNVIDDRTNLEGTRRRGSLDAKQYVNNETIKQCQKGIIKAAENPRSIITKINREYREAEQNLNSSIMIKHSGHRGVIQAEQNSNELKLPMQEADPNIKTGTEAKDTNRRVLVLESVPLMKEPNQSNTNRKSVVKKGQREVMLESAPAAVKADQNKTPGENQDHSVLLESAPPDDQNSIAAKERGRRGLLLKSRKPQNIKISLKVGNQNVKIQTSAKDRDHRWEVSESTNPQNNKIPTIEGNRNIKKQTSAKDRGQRVKAPESTPQTTTCYLCHKTYKNKWSLTTHLRAKHLVTSQTRARMPCLEDGCGFRANRIARLITHLIQAHQLKFECEKVTFKDKEDFWKWKKETEERCHSTYSAPTSAKRTAAGDLKYFLRCSRSGYVNNRRRGEGGGRDGEKLPRKEENEVGEEGSNRDNLLWDESGRVDCERERRLWDVNDKEGKIFKERERGEKGMERRQWEGKEREWREVKKEWEGNEQVREIWEADDGDKEQSDMRDEEWEPENRNRRERRQKGDSGIIKGVRTCVDSEERDGMVWKKEKENSEWEDEKELEETISRRNERGNKEINPTSQGITIKEEIREGNKVSARGESVSEDKNAKITGTRNRRSNSAKINAVCTSFMVAVFPVEGGAEVNFCRTHYGHQMGSYQPRMTAKERVAIKDMILTGFSAAEIMASLRDSLPSHRQHIVKYSNVYNVATRHNLFLARGRDSSNVAAQAILSRPDVLTQMDVLTQPDDLPRLGVLTRMDELNVEREIEVQESMEVVGEIEVEEWMGDNITDDADDCDNEFQEAGESIVELEGALENTETQILNTSLLDTEPNLSSLQEQVMAKISRVSSLAAELKSKTALMRLDSHLESLLGNLKPEMCIELVPDTVESSRTDIVLDRDIVGNDILLFCSDQPMDEFQKGELVDHT